MRVVVSVTLQKKSEEKSRFNALTAIVRSGDSSRWNVVSIATRAQERKVRSFRFSFSCLQLRCSRLSLLNIQGGGGGGRECSAKRGGEGEGGMNMELGRGEEDGRDWIEQQHDTNEKKGHAERQEMKKKRTRETTKEGGEKRQAEGESSFLHFDPDKQHTYIHTLCIACPGLFFC